ncbi:hypothetical protein [Epilithonimonas hominis]|uniref:hypothetical protein n=1 Tax=Epilithonimonas hominis TaxID=420404 RepID=UPI00289AEB2E|nr:hypothetical protein [Epilithonimonas hominis]
MTEKTDYLRDAGSVRKYVLQTFKELKYGFTNEVDLPTFYDNVDSIDVLYENDLVSGKVGKWLPFIERLKSEVEEYKNINESIDFLIEYLFYHLDYIKDRIKPKTIQTPKQLKEFKDYFIADIKDIDGLKKLMQEEKGKYLAGIIYILQRDGFIEENIEKQSFYESFNKDLNHSGVNKYLRKNIQGLCLLDNEDMEEHIQLVEKQLLALI